MGLGKASLDTAMIDATVSQRRDLESERQTRETEEQRQSREVISFAFFDMMNQPEPRN
jgi:hypothetical protein